MKSCFVLPDFLLDTVLMKKMCKYHKRERQIYKSDDLVRSFCADAFYVAYPYCLALLYGANRNDFKNGEIRLRCPNERGITFEVKRIHRWPFYLRVIKKIFIWLVSKILCPIDWVDWNIQIKVIENNGGGTADFAVGKSYSFNINRLDELCPASFYTIYPNLLHYLLGYNPPWQKDGEPANIHCPDHEGMIYDVEIINERNKTIEKRKSAIL